MLEYKDSIGTDSVVSNRPRDPSKSNPRHSEDTG